MVSLLAIAGYVIGGAVFVLIAIAWWIIGGVAMSVAAGDDAYSHLRANKCNYGILGAHGVKKNHEA